VPCAVVAPAYRRAPEHPFPAAVEDARAATVWVVDQAEALGLDAERIAVGGSSAGGNLAAAVTLLLRHQAPRLVFQLLVYPPLDARAADEGDDPRFGREDVAWCWSHYLSDPADGEDARASPLRAADLSGLPPALVVTAEHDPLRSEGERYAERLRAAGVQAKVARFDGMPHGFLGLALDAARDAFDLAAAELRRAFDAEPPLIAATTEE
jgi:acetyl esterase